jgi:hypothetical protein
MVKVAPVSTLKGWRPKFRLALNCEDGTKVIQWCRDSLQAPAYWERIGNRRWQQAALSRPTEWLNFHFTKKSDAALFRMFWLHSTDLF